MKCRLCGLTMKTVMHFENGQNKQFKECPKCHFRTHAKSINYKQFNDKEINHENSRNR